MGVDQQAAHAPCDMQSFLRGCRHTQRLLRPAARSSTAVRLALGAGAGAGLFSISTGAHCEAADEPSPEELATIISRLDRIALDLRVPGAPTMMAAPAKKAAAVAPSPPPPAPPPPAEDVEAEVKEEAPAQEEQEEQEEAPQQEEPEQPAQQQEEGEDEPEEEGEEEEEEEGEGDPDQAAVLAAVLSRGDSTAPVDPRFPNTNQNKYCCAPP